MERSEVGPSVGQFSIATVSQEPNASDTHKNYSIKRKIAIKNQAKAIKSDCKSKEENQKLTTPPEV